MIRSPLMQLRYVLIVVQVLARDVIFGNFASSHFRDIGILRVLHSINGISFKRIAFFRQLFHTFRISARGVGNLLSVTRLSG